MNHWLGAHYTACNRHCMHTTLHLDLLTSADSSCTALVKATLHILVLSTMEVYWSNLTRPCPSLAPAPNCYHDPAPTCPDLICATALPGVGTLPTSAPHAHQPVSSQRISAGLRVGCCCHLCHRLAEAVSHLVSAADPCQHVCGSGRGWQWSGKTRLRRVC